MIILIYIIFISINLSSADIECAFSFDLNSHFSEYPFDGYRCDVISIDYSKDYVEVAVGSHLDGMANENVKSIKISSKTLQKIPKEFSEIFGNLEEIFISSAGLTEINSADLREYKSLIALNLKKNQITTLPYKLFTFTPRLKYIDFSYNRLKYIDVDIFDDVLSLEFADFSFNICTGKNLIGKKRDEVVYEVESLILRECKIRDEDLKYQIREFEKSEVEF